MKVIGKVSVLTLLLVLSGLSEETRAQDYNALQECAALSPLLDDIHNCMDNYLDLMDSNIGDITEFLTESLSGEALAGLNRSQQAFVEYRRQNCLWYLEFSSPRIEAEQIAKNCLAKMSRQRLQELQTLVSTEDTTGQAQRGFLRVRTRAQQLSVMWLWHPILARRRRGDGGQGSAAVSDRCHQ